MYTLVLLEDVVILLCFVCSEALRNVDLERLRRDRGKRGIIEITGIARLRKMFFKTVAKLEMRVWRA